MEVIANKTSSLYSFLFWKYYFIQMRPYLLFVSGICGLSGVAMGLNETTQAWRVVLASVVFFFGYGFGQALTDCFQTDTDKLSAPYRPLSQGVVSVRSVLVVSIAGLCASAVILLILHPLSFFLSILAVFGLATYSYIKRKFWFAGPFYNAWIVALLPIMGFYAMNEANNQLPGFLFPIISVSFFSYACFVLMGYLKDIEADKETGYNTFPVKRGWDATVIAGDILSCIMVIILWNVPKWNLPETLAAIGGSGVILYGQLRAHLTDRKNEEGACIPILSTVRSFILVHISIILHFEPRWWVILLVYYIMFELFLKARPSRFQV